MIDSFRPISEFHHLHGYTYKLNPGLNNQANIINICAHLIYAPTKPPSATTDVAATVNAVAKGATVVIFLKSFILTLSIYKIQCSTTKPGGPFSHG